MHLLGMGHVDAMTLTFDLSPVKFSVLDPFWVNSVTKFEVSFPHFMILTINLLTLKRYRKLHFMHNIRTKF